MAKKILAALALFLVFIFTLSSNALAVCPVCTVTVGAALGISRMLGVDDTVTGVWIGGLILSVSLWSADWLTKKYKASAKYKKFIDSIAPKNIPLSKFITFSVTFLVYSLTFVPLYYTKYIGLPFNRLWGVDKIVLSAGVGSVAFLTGVWADRKIREIKGKQLFNYQKVVFPVVALIITSAFFYMVTK